MRWLYHSSPGPQCSYSLHQGLLIAVLRLGQIFREPPRLYILAQSQSTHDLVPAPERVS